ncbi:DNA polymerase domain-containing protein [Acrocarpospora pleiomorpha]|uniref:DNA polymerase domain-containing protein n=1 Tax=Acrocarpospora pleiomorpha TaxID=90975 RepID=A0A5M3XAG4_9ACTN|nr:DNA polymerase domain-containing protein [Acrocarpospora pleiomorpha]GES18687.1 DNA polymerase domain-containing protein [Acrocarpospora pleiomorpha]
MSDAEIIEVAGREVKITSPERVVFPRTGHTKLDLVRFYAAVGEGALRGVADRPLVLKRFVHGVDEEPFFQKRAPAKRPAWIEVAELRYPSGRSAEEVVGRDLAAVLWTVNLGCVDLNPHPVRVPDLDHPDELRIDLDPVPGVSWDEIVDVAFLARDVLGEHGLTAWPKTSGSRGFHVYARITPGWTFPQLRKAAEAVAREIESRAPGLATSHWWKEERQGVFVDFNQNARDRTVASAYSVRPTGLVSTPLRWDEVRGCRPEAFSLDTVPARFAAEGDPWAEMDSSAAEGSLDSLLALAKEQGPRPKAPKGTGRRQPTMPLIEIARAQTKNEALVGLDRWKARHPEVAALLEPADILIDSMRGRSSAWTRIRINLQHVPESERPAQEPLEVDYDPWKR